MKMNTTIFAFIMKKIFIVFMLISSFCKAQYGVQTGMVGSTIFNSNPNTLVAAFSPNLNFELAGFYTAKLHEKFGVRLEAGYANRGGSQANVIGQQFISRHSIGYAYSMLALQYYTSPDFSIFLGAMPSYMVLYRKNENGGSNNVIQGMDPRYKTDLPIAMGLHARVAHAHHVGARFNYGTTPFSKQTNFNPPSTDRFYQRSITVYYTYTLGGDTEEEESEE
jgi:hypothetical protein